jgi:hypothetical protein
MWYSWAYMLGWAPLIVRKGWEIFGLKSIDVDLEDLLGTGTCVFELW